MKLWRGVARKEDARVGFDDVKEYYVLCWCVYCVMMYWDKRILRSTWGDV